MDDVQNRLARELADAVAAAVAGNPEVERCRDRARAAGFHLKLSLEATVGFAQVGGAASADEPADGAVADGGAVPAFAISPNDRRFLRSLRIAADEPAVEEAN